MKDVLVVEFKNPDDKKHYAVIGVTGVNLADDDIVIHTEDPEKSIVLSEDPIKIKSLKLNIYRPRHNEISDLLGIKDLFAIGMKIIDGRKKEKLEF